jgi:hypothetical protein
MPKHPSHILELAKRGAEVRLRELVQETKYLIDLFPHLRDSFDTEELPLKFIMAEGSGAATKTTGRRGRRKMSAAVRKKISEAQKMRSAARTNETTAAQPETAPVRKQRGMSAAARKAVSERMKVYWAERRKKKQAGRKETAK